MVVGETNYILHRRSLIISNRSLGLIWRKSFTKAIFIGLPVILTYLERSLFRMSATKRTHEEINYLVSIDAAQ